MLMILRPLDSLSKYSLTFLLRVHDAENLYIARCLPFPLHTKEQSYTKIQRRTAYREASPE